MGNRRPGGKADPVMAGERSRREKLPFGRGEKTSSSRLTSVNCSDGHDTEKKKHRGLRTL